MAVTDSTPQAAPAIKAPTPWIIAPVVALAAFMEVLDISIANVALKHIAGSMSASQDESTWILTSYLVTNAIVLPVSGWLSSVLGRKRFYMACIAGFGASSLLCGLAPSLAMLIAFRALQGLTGGGLQPSSQAILADNFPPHQRGMAFAFYGIAVVFAPAIGPTLGGWITDNFSWRWVFLVNVPVSIILFFLIEAMISDPPHLIASRAEKLKHGFKVDYLGFGLLALGLGFLQVVLDRGQEDDWFSSNFVLFSAIVAASALIFLIVWELAQSDPIIDLALFKNANFAMSNVLMFLLGFILLGSTAMIPLYVQSMLGYTATDAGMVISPGGFAIMLLMPIIGRLVSKVDSRTLIVIGLAISAAALASMSRYNLDVDFWTIAIARMVQAAGLAFLFIPISTVAYAGVPVERYNNASALVNLSRNLGGSVGIAVLTTLLARRSQYHQNVLVEHVGAYSRNYADMAEALQARMLGDGGTAAEAMMKAQAVIAMRVEQQATLLSYLDNFLVLAAIFALLIPFVFFMRRPPAPEKPASAH
ncbi:MAG: DHA2 family efflux MFS transporter permease subunit [Proteobacteria bacterium]|nr:DHA2 family efflux MFS transporter permease subunit [Pseudomonadota bacterium]MBI3496210.1 DHA2 family efflux MFS transporter permease subunit [Pseudomonadota bacterium]